MEAGFRCNLLEFVWPKRHLPTNPAGPFPGGGGGYGSPAEVIIFGGFPSLFIGSTCINSFEAVCRTCFQRLLLPPQPACGGMPILLAFRHPMSYLTLSCLLWVVIFQWPFGDCIQKKPSLLCRSTRSASRISSYSRLPCSFWNVPLQSPSRAWFGK